MYLTLPWQPQTESTPLQNSTNQCQIMFQEQFVSWFPTTQPSLITMEHYLLLFSITHLSLILMFFIEAEKEQERKSGGFYWAV